MKKKSVLYCLLGCIVFLCIACQEKPSNTIIISGTIKNAKEGFSLESGYGFEKNDMHIRLDSEGKFHDTITAKEGIYYIYDGSNFPISVYLQPNNRYRFEYDVTQFDKNGIHITGNDVDISNYYVEKRRKKVFFNPYGDGKTEAEFRDFLNTIKEQQLQLLTDAKLPKAIETYEKTNIQYEYLSYLYLYLLFNEIENPSAISKSELDIDYANAAHYEKFGGYSRLLYEYYMAELSRKNDQIIQTNPSYNSYISAIKDLDAIIPDQFIKNKIIADMCLHALKNSSDINATYKDFKKYYTGDNSELKNNMNDLYLRFTKLKKGTASPKFVNFENYNGGTHSLDDFKGTFVFVDLWASWCGNCIGEIPYLKKLETAFEDSNITFVSISSDKDKKAWRKAIKENTLSGIQLLATDNSFHEAYGVYGIPRYILIDPEGNIVDHNTPRPSDPKLIALLQNIDLKTQKTF
ncbi:MAG: TlpA disulfide reductase family protein [Bacteroidota bacterium]